MLDIMGALKNYFRGGRGILSISGAFWDKNQYGCQPKKLEKMLDPIGAYWEQNRVSKMIDIIGAFAKEIDLGRWKMLNIIGMF